MRYYAAELGLHPAALAANGSAAAAATNGAAAAAAEQTSQNPKGMPAATTSIGDRSVQIPELDAASSSEAAEPVHAVGPGMAARPPAVAQCAPATAQPMPPASEAEFAKWFPGLKLSGTATGRPR